MLIVQKFHSLKEIDGEFIPAIELLMTDHWVDFNAWLAAEAASPADVTFNYWLFFGPTQNSPVGIAQVSLKKLEVETLLPWWKKLTRLWDKSLDHWKRATWQLALGIDGPAVFDPRFARTGFEKLQELFKEVEAREDVMAVTVLRTSDKSAPAAPSKWSEIHQTKETSWQMLKAWTRSHRHYQDYLADLAPEMGRQIQVAWKTLHKEHQITLGDYPTLESRQDLLIHCPDLDETHIAGFPGGLLTFQKDGVLLGFVHYRAGLGGTLFAEPVPLEISGQELVSDMMYVQYALLKAHENEQARRVIIIRQGAPFRLSDQSEEGFFKDQGFGINLVHEHSWSRSEYVGL
jgi:hypothetical protein